MALVTVRDGQQLHVRVLGRGRPVLMLSGLGMHSGHWLPFIWPFLYRFKFYLPDFRGIGQSGHVRFNQADIFQNHMEDVQDVIAHFRLNDYLLAGYSLGGSTALHLQRAGGFASVSRYLHIDQSPCIGNRADWPHGVFGARQDELFSQMHRLHDVLVNYTQFDQLAELPEQARRQAAAILAEVLTTISGHSWLKPLLAKALMSPKLLSKHLPLTQVQDCVACLSAYTKGGHDYRASLKGCETPITVMVGMKSPLYAPAGQMAIADYAANVRIVRLHNSGHVPLTDEPINFVRELGRWLKA